MRRFFIALFSLLCLLFVTGCTPADSGAENAAQLSSLPRDAQLVYTYVSNQASGVGVADDAWSHEEDTGFFVLEFLPDSGSIRQVELRRGNGEAVASIGTVQRDGVFITDLVTEAGGDYALYFGKADDFVGEINVYFVAGIGYDTAD